MTPVYLADTTVWHWAHHPVARAALQTEIDRGTVATCAIIDAELMVSARSEREATDIAPNGVPCSGYRVRTRSRITS